MTEVTSSLLTPNWVLIGATVQGSHHLLESAPCQDAQAFLSLKGALLVTIADGLGSAPFAQSGAELAVKAAMETAGEQLASGEPDEEEGWIELMKVTFAATRTRLEAEASQQGASLSDFGTTLVLVILTNRWLAAAHIGDGAVVQQDSEDVFSTICVPQTGEYANETFSLTLPDALERVVYHASQVKIKALGLLSDGLLRFSIRQTDFSPHIPFFGPLFNQLQSITDPGKAAHSLAGFLSSEKVRSLSGDDKTLVLVGRIT